MIEIVVDANVFVHSNNPSEKFFESAVALVTELFESDLVLALDDTGKNAPDEWTSNLFREYSESIAPLSFAANVVQALLAAERFAFHLRPSRAVWDQCRALVPRNTNDAIVLAVGACCADRYIVTNDYADFDSSVRKSARKKLKVDLVDSIEHSELA